MSSTAKATVSERNPDVTRRRILEAAFRVMYRKGYQGMRLDEVVTLTGLTKGALYHHFSNKQAIACAVVDEIVQGMVEQWLAPIEHADDPLEALIMLVSDLPAVAGEDVVRYGCPLNNLAQEMSPLDESLRTRIDAIYQYWLDGLQAALLRAREAGQLRPELDCERLAGFIVAALEGCIGMAKNAQDSEQLRSCGEALGEYLRFLRA